MLSSIHPLGERARNNKWSITVLAFAFSAAAAGAIVGGALGLIGNALLGSTSPTVRLAIIAIGFLGAGLLDLLRVDPLGPSRQVNEHWIGYYRGWVYGGAFGAQLGLGVVTYVVTWGVYATLLSELLLASVGAGGAVGAAFGLGRSVALLLAWRVDKPSRLATFHRRMADLGPVLRRASAVAVTGVGLTAVVGMIL